MTAAHPAAMPNSPSARTLRADLPNTIAAADRLEIWPHSRDFGLPAFLDCRVNFPSRFVFPEAQGDGIEAERARAPRNDVARSVTLHWSSYSGRPERRVVDLALNASGTGALARQLAYLYCLRNCSILSNIDCNAPRLLSFDTKQALLSRCPCHRETATQKFRIRLADTFGLVLICLPVRVAIRCP